MNNLSNIAKSWVEAARKKGLDDKEIMKIPRALFLFYCFDREFNNAVLLKSDTTCFQGTGQTIRHRLALQCTELHDGLVEVTRMFMADQLFCFFQDSRFSFWGAGWFPDSEVAGKKTKDVSIHNR